MPPEAVLTPTFKEAGRSWRARCRGLHGTNRFNTIRNHAAAVSAFMPTFGPAVAATSGRTRAGPASPQW